MRRTDRRRSIRAWAMYDWANSAFATAVMAGFFPIHFKQYWAAGMAASESTFWLGLANGAAGLMVAVMAPVLGAVADRCGAKKRLLLAFAGLGVVMTGGLFFAREGAWVAAMLLYALAAIGFSAGNVFYDALLTDVAAPGELDRVSALGYGLGYLGGGLLFALDVAAVTHPRWFGLAGTDAAVRAAFLSVALWWAAFSLPLILRVRESAPAISPPILEAARAGVAELADTFHHVRRFRAVWLFLVAYWLYIDGVGTIARMALDYGLALGIDARALIGALLLTQFVAFPAAIVFGRVGERHGPKAGILVGIGVYAGLCVWSLFMKDARDFWWLAGVSGLVMGGVQSLSRSLYARLIPRDKAGEFFGFYNMMGKFAAILGPVLMAVVSLASGSNRLAVLSVAVLFLVGGAVLWRVQAEPAAGG